MASTRLYGPTRSSSAVVAASTYGGTVAPLPAKQVIAVTTETVIADPGILTNALILSIPPGGPCEQRPFEVAASGYLTTAQTSTALLKLYLGSSLTAASNTALGATLANTVTGAITVPWFLSARLIYDSVSGKLDGIFQAIMNGVLVVPVKITSSPIAPTVAINNANNPVLNFVLSVTFGTATAANTINVQEFAVNL